MRALWGVWEGLGRGLERMGELWESLRELGRVLERSEDFRKVWESFLESMGVFGRVLERMGKFC